jgi:hypothetical protein
VFRTIYNSFMASQEPVTKFGTVARENKLGTLTNHDVPFCRRISTGFL